MEAWNVRRAVYAAQFNTHGATLTRSLVILLVPMLAALLAVVLAPARASGVRHLVFATHGLSFVLAGVVMLGGPLLFIALLWVRLTGSFPVGSFDPYLSPVMLAAILARGDHHCHARSTRRVKGDSSTGETSSPAHPRLRAASRAGGL